jgi:hypothetical protein
MKTNRPEWLTTDTDHVHIENECASGIILLPEIWQRIANNEAPCASPDKETLIKMAMLMHHKLTKGHVDLFPDREVCSRKLGFINVMGPEVLQMLTYFGHDWTPERYPNFEEVESKLDTTDFEYSDRLGVLKIGKALFEHFGYHLPASFYWVYLAPIERSGVCDIVPLRFSESDKQNARAWDSWLHAGKVFPFLHTIQSISSETAGMIWLHGCGCNHGLSRLGKGQESFHYRMGESEWLMWVRDAIWTAMYEYAFFLFTPVTRLMTSELVEFSE